VTGYHLQATDGELGHVDDLLIDDLDWAIRYVVVKTGKWWLGHKSLLPPEWMQEINWERRDVLVNVTRQAVGDAPEDDSVAHVNRHVIGVCRNGPYREGVGFACPRLRNAALGAE
jgi:hypothetical protein